MQLSSTLAALAVLAATVLAAPAPLESRQNFACSPDPETCGKPGALICCPDPPITVPHLAPPPSYGEEKRDADPVDLQGRFVCVKPSYGCGTKLKPKCCQP